ncbi:MAG: hypothetical protein ACYDAG_11855 [Chloroflexota bacterium]
MVVSVGLGGLFWAWTRDIRTVAVSLVFGVLIDIDHLFDYFYAERKPRFSPREFLRTRYWRKSGRLFLLFHGFEYLPLVYLVWQSMRGRRWALAATSAMSIHLLADHLVNGLRPLGYFVSYRAAHRFRAAELLDFEAMAREDARHKRHQRLAAEGRLPLHSRLLDLIV